MKMVASAKLHKAQAAIGGKLPYEQKLHHILSGLLQDDDLQKAMHDRLGFGNPHGHSAVVLEDIGLDQVPSKDAYPRIAIVAFSSNSALCGAFNANVIRKYHETVSILEGQGYGKDDIDIYAVGRKMADAVRKSGYHLAGDYPEMADKPSYEQAADLAYMLVDSFTSGEVAQVVLVYSHFASPASQPAVRENYLPLPLHDYDEGTDEPIDYILEPDPLELVRHLLPQGIKGHIGIADAFPAKLDLPHLGNGKRTIRAVGGVPHVQDGFIGQLVDHCPGHRQPAHPGVENTNRGVVIGLQRPIGV